MPEVSFYILPSASLQERNLFTCKLAEKIYRQKIYSFILTDSEAHSEIMDDLLWTFRASSFVPHQIYSGSSATELKQILISADPAVLPEGATLINLSQYYPEQLDKVERILEVLNQDAAVLQAGRNRYRQYQQAGVKLTTHKL
jgi:DNA polymerase III subunit chi